MPWLTRGRLLTSDVTQHNYKVTSHRMAQGGFGEVYRGVELDEHRDPCRDVAIKVSLRPIAWHGEAYFGRLLAGQPNVVQFHDAFPLIDGRGAGRLVKYVLVLDWMDEGTVNDALSDPDAAWSEDVVCDQVTALLRVLVRLHHRSICHGDITPGNVFVRDGELLLGDLGIAKQSLDEGPIAMDGTTPDSFLPPDIQPYYWSPSDDVYQLGLLALSLLSGRVITAGEVSLRSVDASDEFTEWLFGALAPARDRFRDAQEALDCLVGQPVRVPSAPRTLRDQRVVFTGSLNGMKRDRAVAQARRAGAVVQSEVNGATTLIVSGERLAPTHGKTLFGARLRIRRGQRIAIIDPERFARLLKESRRA